MPLLTFTVPGPPQGAQRHRVQVRGGRAHIHRTDNHIAYEERIAMLAMHAASKAGLSTIATAVRVVIETWHRRPQSASKARKWWGTAAYPFVGRPDSDNCAKLALDACTKARVWTDDTVVAQLEVRRWWVAVDEHGDQDGERTTVTVEGL